MSTARVLKQDYEELRELVGSMSARAHHRMTFDALVSKWEQLVAAVERGYDDSIHEYTNDLSVRNLLEKIIAAGSPSLAASVSAIIHPADLRFLRSTRPAAKPFPGDSSAFWWKRVPERLVGELRQDLLADGIISE